MIAIQVLKSIRGVSFRGMGFVGAFFGRSGHLRRDQERREIAWTDAMTPTNQGTQAWLGKISRNLGDCVMTVLENVNVCVGGSMVAAAANSPSSESSEVSLLSSFFSSSAFHRIHTLSLFFKFMRYGQTSNSLGFYAAWNCPVNAPNHFRMIQEIKTKAASSYHHQLFRAIAEELSTKIFPKFHQRQFRIVAAEAAHKASTKLWQFEDTMAIQDYSGDGYRELNPALRTNSCTEEVRDRVDAVVKAMTKLPRFKGRVYRGTELPFGTDLTAGAEFCDLGFLSTSRLKKKAFIGSHLFVITSFTGVDIVKHAVKKIEKEVLYPPGTRFLIKSVKTDISDNRKIVEMEEMA